MRSVRRAPDGLQLALAVVVLGLALAVANFAYQIARKPTELFFVVAGEFDKTPAETWNAYRRAFRRHSTPVMSPALLAALAQTEGAGNPVARTYWRFRPGFNPFDVYRPASSAVGMYQITDGTFEQARRFCIHDHRVTREGPWNDFDTCWLNELYFRVLPDHAIEMTSAYLDHQVARILARRDTPRTATAAQKRDLATVIHLCGPSVGVRFAARGFGFRAGERCGSHDPRHYLRRVRELTKVFARWDTAD